MAQTLFARWCDGVLGPAASGNNGMAASYEQLVSCCRHGSMRTAVRSITELLNSLRPRSQARPWAHRLRWLRELLTHFPDDGGAALRPDFLAYLMRPHENIARALELRRIVDRRSAHELESAVRVTVRHAAQTKLVTCMTLVDALYFRCTAIWWSDDAAAELPQRTEACSVDECRKQTLSTLWQTLRDAVALLPRRPAVAITASFAFEIDCGFCMRYAMLLAASPADFMLSHDRRTCHVIDSGVLPAQRYVTGHKRCCLWILLQCIRRRYHQALLALLQQYVEPALPAQLVAVVWAYIGVARFTTFEETAKTTALDAIAAQPAWALFADNDTPTGNDILDLMARKHKSVEEAVRDALRDDDDAEEGAQD
jgi:hypothetical protein